MGSGGRTQVAFSPSLTPCVFDRDPLHAKQLVSLIAEIGYHALSTDTPEEALRLCRHGMCRVILVSGENSNHDDHDFLDRIRNEDPGVQVILISRSYTLDSAMEAIRHGATDFMPHPVDKVRLKRTLDEIAALYDQKRRVRELEAALLEDLEFHGIVGKSPTILEVFDFARKIARHYSNVLIVGPTGSGKEVIARVLHKISPVAQEQLALCNCSAFVDSLLESQLFGHMRGAFTGATETRLGLFEYANGGTVFLDEIGETSLAMQAKLLRVIQNREIQRVGSPEVRRINVRIIAATNRDLKRDVQEGRFRQDLYYRLSSIQIRIPSLAERLDDIPLLIHFFLKKFNALYHKSVSGLTRRAQTVILRHSWPGNVRELENVISMACMTTTGDFIDLHDLPEQFQHGRASEADFSDPGALRLDAVCFQHVETVLRMCNGNRVRAAQVLGISRTSLYRYLRSSQDNCLPLKAAGASAA
jgi:two-component system response regulator HydG